MGSFACQQSSSDPVYEELWTGIQRFLLSDPTVLSNDATILLNKVRSENFVLFSYHHTSVSMFGRDCNIEIVEVEVKTILISLNLPKGSALVKPLNDMYVIQQLSVQRTSLNAKFQLLH